MGALALCSRAANGQLAPGHVLAVVPAPGVLQAGVHNRVVQVLATEMRASNGYLEGDVAPSMGWMLWR